MSASDGQLVALIVIVAVVWVFCAFGVPKLFPTGRWSDLGRFFKRRKR